MSVILGLNMFHAGSSAAIIMDGKPIVAIAEERLNRVKYYAGFPKLAIQRCLDIAGLTLQDIDVAAIGRDSAANQKQKIEYVLKHPTRLLNFFKIKALKSPLDDLKTLLSTECQIDPQKLRFTQYNVEHHLAHIASSYFISPWERSAGFSIDGSGDFVTCMLAACEGESISTVQRCYVPHSLGSLYTMICEFIGYKKYGDEGKVMGLSALGQDSYYDRFEDMITLTHEGFELNPKYFLPFGSGQGMRINERGEIQLQRHFADYMVELFGQPREPYSAMSQRDMDLACGVQRMFEKVYFHLLNRLYSLVTSDRIAMAGGCVLNSVANGKVFENTPFRQTCIQPAAGDEGLALGAALYASNVLLKEGKRFVMRNAYLGPEFSEAVIKKALESQNIRYTRYERESLLWRTAEAIANGKVVGWFQGRMEWGPRALGNRSILCHPGLPDMKDILNARIKRREWFRPFAPSVLVERQADIFEHAHPSPFMLHVYTIRPGWREKLVAVNHVDDTGRLQSVAYEENPLYYDLIKTFEQQTGLPVVLNTSFNENEPIVCSPEEAIDCYIRTRMDVLVIGPFMCWKKDPERLAE
ncbi:putative nodulation protein nolNO [Candidatus Vecturithrix granuli]|uniref:Putative nodulation protein nolNO n=1 Tax=Vecturithrix granuli TaxID=1499967 RepID=A0A081BXU4_VECG1|nr:putative nodulation protein nolNO [Candidatus Vecturithrix granuli]